MKQTSDALDDALSLVHAGSFAQAEALAREVVGRDPGNAQAYYVLGLSSLFQNRHADALERIEQALELDRTNAQYHFARAACLAASGRADAAIAAYRKALEFRPQFFEALANVGNLLERSVRFAEAAEAYRRALELRPDEVFVLNGLGACEIAIGRPKEAAEVLKRAVRLKPDFAAALNNLARASWLTGAPDEAIGLLRRAVDLRPDFTEAWINLGDRHYRARNDDEALKCFDRALALDPSNDEIRFLRDSIRGNTVERAPDQFVRNFFDRFAPEFDARLVGDLDYRTPQAMAEFLQPWLAAREGLRVADLGCGTGLSGIFVRSKAAFLAGMDLSAKMLDEARKRAIYDELTEAEILDYLDRRPTQAFDLVLAVDVFVYVGELEPIVRACARALISGGVLAFSVENLDDPKLDFRLARTGRFAHSPRYIARVAANAGLRIMDSRATALRKEDTKPVMGDLYALEKP